MGHYSLGLAQSERLSENTGLLYIGLNHTVLTQLDAVGISSLGLLSWKDAVSVFPSVDSCEPAITVPHVGGQLTGVSSLGLNSLGF